MTNPSDPTGVTQPSDDDATQADPGKVVIEGLIGNKAAARSGLASVLGEDFSAKSAIGGWRGAVESALPGFVFVVVFTIWSQLMPALIASGGTAIVLTLIRLIQRTPVTQALGGLIGVGIGVWWAAQSGRGENYYAGALLINVAYGLACLISIVVRWPVVGLVVGTFADMSLTAWRKRPDFYRRARLGTWLLVAMFALRLAVKTPLYFGGHVAWLGTFHLLMGIPLYALTLWAVWLLLRGHVRAPDGG
ncbi:MAG: DUF3159 domain-containing protein [Bifidobacteriaceae bacterium]|jgi:hypothetical protein|nr:DUF3159 domain-containing protein [Bifidobacteriaceae bacterium]